MSNENTQPKRGMAVATRAAGVARVFDVLAWVVVIAGALNVLVGIVLLFDDAWFGIAYIAGAIVVTALYWAGISLATVIAGYIAQRAE